ncbi:MAG: hypothetical protein SCALA702_33890 [Melioribacteraceae bacterium]|nr:MAG: hypothetical protein SCALA702_33890 [Melioribacteraceae bacterium]
MFELITILLIALLLRIMFGTLESSDDWASLWYIMNQRGKKWLNFYAEDTVNGGRRGYPVLQHFIISKFPEKNWKVVGRFFVISYDFLMAALAVFMLYELQSAGVISFSDNDYLYYGIFAGLLLISPVMMPSTARMQAVNARTLGMLLTVLYFYFLGKVVVFDNYFFIPVVLAVGYLIILSSQFGIQVFLFFSIIISVFLLNPVPFLFMAFIVGTSFLFKGFGSYEVLTFNINHKRWYFSNFNAGTTASNRNKLKEFILAPIYLFIKTTRFFQLLMRDNSVFIAIYSMIPLWYLGYLLYENQGVYNSIASNGLIYYYFALLIAGLITFLLTTIRSFSFLGQSERYFEYSLIYTLIVLFFVLDQLKIWEYSKLTTVLHINLLWILGVFIFVYNERRKSKKSSEESSAELVEFIYTNCDESRIAIIPLKMSHYISYRLRLKKKKKNIKFYYRFSLLKRDKGFKIYQNEIGGSIRGNKNISIDIFKMPLADIKERYQLTHILIQNSYMKRVKENWGEDTIDKLAEPVFSNDDYKLFRI